ncbi:hypothetical protein Ddye_013460 [Dipteronia dyeriana]|uniref:Nucleosome assembly protein n=1 Tax=Dipteronia dyeriana TaxID=168575 RepID=A0AAE0CJN3_9ROSI|nr:hypothetical protein Ddye_013460 [Dipteronia dyeriana]
MTDHGVAASASATGISAGKPARSSIAQKASDQTSQREEVEKKYYEERSALEAKYEKLYEPCYSKRYEIVNGIVKVEDGDFTKEGGDKATKEEGVPNFWLTAMKFNEALAKEISKRDEGALKYLQDIKWCRIGDPKGFKLEFLFDPNPYFKNSVLTKTYPMSDDFVAIPEKAIGTRIEWYPGKCLTQDPEKKIWEMEGCESFFNFFKAPMVLEDDTDLNPDDDHSYDFNFYKDEEVPKDNFDGARLV